MADISLQTGTVFASDFRILRPISSGGMGAVYEAEQISTGKHRALKVMLPQLVADPSLRKRFEQEARIASMIESEHVVEVVGAGIDAGAGVPWLAMELLNGEDLSKTVARRGALAVPEVVLIFEQLCHAVGAAHRASIVHRDLKPENIFLAQAKRAGVTFTVKVLDFGIAKIVAEAKTKLTAAMGSPIWMAPEQAERSPITAATDVWALGLVAFYLLTGRFYWKAANSDDATIPQLMREVLFEPIVVASSRAQELGMALAPAFDGWFARCVARDPGARFVDANEAWSALAAALGATAASLPAQNIGGGGTPPIPYAAIPAPPTQAPDGAPPAPVARAAGATGGVASYTIGNPQAARADAPVVLSPRRSLGPVVALVLGVVTVIGIASLVLWIKVRPGSPETASTVSSLAAPDPAPAGLPGPDAASSTELAVVPDGKGVDRQDSSQTASDPVGGQGAAPIASVAAHVPPRPVTTAATVAVHTPVQPVPAPVAPAPPQPTAPPAPAVPPQRSLDDLANSVTSADWQKARNVLEPKVVTGTATQDEIKLLEVICKNQKDRACLKACKKQLKNSR